MNVKIEQNNATILIKTPVIIAKFKPYISAHSGRYHMHIMVPKRAKN